MAAPLALRFAARELRGGLTGFRVFIAALALGVGAIAAVGSLSASVVTELQNNARAMLGGDVEVSLTARQADDSELAFFGAQADRVSTVRDVRSMARSPAGAVMLVELKGVDEVYPLFGDMALTPVLALADALGNRDGVAGAVAEPELFSRLRLEIGDRVVLGDIEVELRAIIGVEPDRTAGAMALGPRLMVTAETLDATGLVRLGSLVETKYRFALDAATDPGVWLDGLNAAFPQAGWRATEYTSAQPALQTFVDRLSTFLTLVGLTALVIGGVGVGNAVRSYLAGKTATIATFKALGASGGLVFKIYFWQVAALAAIGIVLGLVAGALAPLIVGPLIGEALPVAPGFSLHWLPLGLAAAYGVLTATAFALWPLAQAREIPASGLFRAIVRPAPRLPRPRYVALTAAAILALVALAVFGTGDPWLGAWFAAGAAAGLAGFRLAASAVIRVIMALPRSRRPALRLALASLTRPGAPTGNVVMSLGLGLSVLVAVALLDANITRQITEQMPNQAPAFFFIDIQPDQVADFDAAVLAVPGVIELDRMPTLRGRVVGINGAPIGLNTGEHEGHWFVHSEIGFTYAEDMTPGTVLTDGQWWPASYDGPPAISLDSSVAHEMEIAVGDTVTFNILGREIKAEVANLRRVDWQAMGINFSVIFAPGALENAPQIHMAAAVVAANAEGAVFEAVTGQFANITAVRVRDVIERATGLLDKISAAVRAISALTLAAGVLVLAGAIAAGRRSRVYDSVILKVLGARRSEVLRVHLLEFGVLGLITGVLAAAAGTLAAWAVVRLAMDADWLLDIPAVIGSAGGGMVLVVILGLAGTWRILGQKPAPVLRTT